MTTAILALALTLKCDPPGKCCRTGETPSAAVAFRGRGKPFKAALWADDGWTNNVLWRRSADFSKEKSVALPPLTRKTPGVVRVFARPAGGKAHLVDRIFFDREGILPLTPCPDDFEAYWRGEKERLAREVPLDAKVDPAPDLSTKDHGMFRVSFATFRGRRVYGFLALPKGAGDGPFPALANVPGAGPGYTALPPWTLRKGWIAMALNVHGFPPEKTSERQRAAYEAWLKEWSKQDGEPKYQRIGMSLGREQPLFHDAMLGIVRGFEWLAAQKYADAERMVYAGISQGGGYGIYATALYGRFAKSLINCPSNCDMLAYLRGREPGSEHAMDQSPSHRDAAERNAPYFDACNFARLVKTPVRLAHGTADDNCNTTGGVAAFNAFASEDKELMLLPGSGHGHYKRAFAEWLYDLPKKPGRARKD